MKDYLLNTVLPACQLAYDAQFAPVAGIELIHSISTAPRSKPLAAMQRDGSIFGYVRVSPDGKSLVIAFRGTQSRMEWGDDFEAIPVRNNYGPGWVHGGIQEVYAAVHGSLWAIVEKYPAIPSVEIVGHSLGGALAVLAGIEITARRIPATLPRITTVAQPAVLGVQPLHFSLATVLPPQVTLTRLVGRYDIVPHLPLPPTYQHIGNRINVNGGIPELFQAHSIGNYRRGLELWTEPSEAVSRTEGK